jgi:hypothetical protein
MARLLRGNAHWKICESRFTTLSSGQGSGVGGQRPVLREDKIISFLFD